jgi:hypothetical protein
MDRGIVADGLIELLALGLKDGSLKASGSSLIAGRHL